jgi:hypothetical protein
VEAGFPKDHAQNKTPELDDDWKKGHRAPAERRQKKAAELDAAEKKRQSWMMIGREVIPLQPNGGRKKAAEPWAPPPSAKPIVAAVTGTA